MRFPEKLLTICVLMLSVIDCSAQDIPEVSSRNIHLRGSLTNSKLVFEQSGKGHVAFIGGSITQMNGYRPMVSAFLEQRFPKTEFEFTNAGISSTCSVTGAHRMTRDVLSKGDVDLLFIEFAVNDDQDAGHDITHAIRGMEGLLAQVRRHNPKADVIVTHFANQSMMDSIRKGETPISIVAHNRVCGHYKISTNDLCAELVELIDDEKTTWDLYGGVHPKPYGNAICTSMIRKLLNQGWAKQVDKVVVHPTPEMLMDVGSYVWGQLADPVTAKHDQHWKVSVPDWTDIPGGFRQQFAGLQLLHSETVQSEFKYTFEGTSLGAYVLAGPDAGVLEVRVDGNETLHTVNLFHRHSKGLHYPRTVMLAEGLKVGRHTITVRIDSSRDAQSRGSAVRILNFATNAKR